jgi:hypothetical protein
MIASFLRVLPAFALLLMLTAAPLPARSQSGKVVPVEGWSIYGAQPRHDVDDAVPGRGIVAITADRPHAQEWGSAASVALPMALRRGEAVSAVFWARAGQPARVPVMLLARDAPHAAFSRRTVGLSTAWQRIVVTGTAPADLAAGSHALSVQLGKAGTQVSLGPLLWLPGGDGPDASAFADQHHEILVAIMAGDAAEARRLASEQYAYCGDIVDQGIGTVDALGASLVGSIVWYFWWD